MQGKCFQKLIPSTKQAFRKLLISCSSRPKLRQIHALILTTGLSIKNSLFTQLLINLTILGDMVYARQLFDEMHRPRTFLWNTLIKGYVKNQALTEAAKIYKKMHLMGIRPDPFTFPFVVKACGEMSEMLAGMVVHGQIVKYGLDFVAVVRTELMVMYVKFGELGLAEYLFESMVEKDLVAWNALIAAFEQMGYGDKALALFHQMGDSGTSPDASTVVSALSACGQLGCLESGQKILEVVRKERIDCNIIVENAQLDMYMKCGSIDMASAMFEKMHRRNVISWSTMIVGYAMNGESEKALALFHRMQNERLQPNHVTYLGVLMACSHAGLVSEGRAFFSQMTNSGNKNIRPRKEHYACVVDLLGRSGHLEEAYNLIETMPFKPDPAVWGALLGACAIHHNAELGQLVADSLFEVASDVASYHVLLSNMYAAAGRWDRVAKVRLRMRKIGVRKEAAYSSIEFGGKSHVFYGGDQSHLDTAVIYEKLKDLLNQIKAMGYIPKTGFVYHDVGLEEKEAALSTHSEKIAIAFGLIYIRPDLPIRVIKNLRVCDDCHTFSKLVSKLTGREIIMRDKSRYHHFRDGSCSCKDFW